MSMGVRLGLLLFCEELQHCLGFRVQGKSLRLRVYRRGRKGLRGPWKKGFTCVILGWYKSHLEIIVPCK